MDTKEIKKSLQSLITRLVDAEKGFREIGKASGNIQIKNMVNLYADERHNMHKKLESVLEDFGGDPDTESSWISSLHRAWIDVKVNGWGDQFTTIVDEIERGSQVLIDEYQIVLDNTNLGSQMYLLLTKQQEQINLELNELRQYKESIEQIEA